MDIGVIPTIKKTALRHYVTVMAFAVVGLGLAVFSVYRYYTPSSLVVPVATSSTPSSTTSATVRSAPVRLTISSIALDASFVSPLGLNSDQTVSVPDNFGQVGWYSGGATPGEVGSAVILGHVDTKTGPAVFYSLGQVQVGDEIRVTRADGITAVFVVTELKRYAQSDFPTVAVYGATDEPTLRLVTCTGTFDRANQRYSHNLVVYAKWLRN